MINTTDILDFINKNPWLNILFIILTLISIFLSIWFYIKSKRTRKPTYCVRTFNLVRDKINKIDSVNILYQGEKIDNLSISKIAIWNGGKETISQSDIAKNDRFRIEIVDTASILDFKLLFEKNNANGFKLTKIDNNCINVEFDYIDFNEGVIIQLYHTATESSDLIIKGSFKGTKEILRNDTSVSIFPKMFYDVLNLKFMKPRVVRKLLGLMTIILPVLLFFVLFIDHDVRQKAELSFWPKVIMISFVTIPYWWMGFRILKRRVPKGFNLFDDEF